MQVLYQLSYTPLDESQCNIPLNPMSRINLALSGKFLKVFALLLCLSSCNILENLTDTAKEPPLKKVLTQQEAPPFALENYQPHAQKYTLRRQIKTVDKRNLRHNHAFIYATSPLNLNTLFQIAAQLPQGDVYWFYISPHANTMEQSIDTETFTDLALCQSIRSREKERVSPPFKPEYIYQNPELSCELNYVP